MYLLYYIMFHYELIDYNEIHTKLEQVLEHNVSYNHSLYINFIEFLSDIYRTCKFNIINLEKQVEVDVKRSIIYINKVKLNKRHDKSARFLKYVKYNHSNNYVKILCLHTQAIYAKALEILIKIINDETTYVFELDYKHKKNLIMKLIDIDTLQFISSKILRIIKINIDGEIENLFLVTINISYTFNEPNIEIDFVIDKYKDLIC